MLVLDEGETRGRLREYGLCSSSEPAFAFFDQERNVHYAWHEHTQHQLLYAISGTVRLQTERVSLLLHPQCAVWIAPGVRHRTTFVAAQTASVFFTPDAAGWPHQNVRLVRATPLLREMLCAAEQWSARGTKIDSLGELFFRTLAGLCAQWTREQPVLVLPGARTEAVARAVDYLLLNLRDADLEAASAAAGMSTRSLRRHFVEETGIPWREYLRKLRVQKALQLWTQKDLTTAAMAVETGFESLSAFSAAFRSIVGEAPGRYRARVRSGKS